MAPLGALVFLDLRRALPWFLAFVGLVVSSGLIDARLAPADVPGWIVNAFFVMNVLGVSTTVYVLLQYFMRAREAEQEKSERLLLNSLPSPVAARLKQSPEVIADGFAGAMVLFADIVEFTRLADRLSPEHVVALLNRVFSAFDALTQRHQLVKIKTIGDAYMVAAGLPIPRLDHAEAVAERALEMREEADRCGREAGVPLAIRIGIDTGPVRVPTAPPVMVLT